MMKISKLDDKRGSGTGRVQVTCLRHYIQRPRTLNLEIVLVMRVSVSCLRVHINLAPRTLLSLVFCPERLSARHVVEARRARNL